MLNHDQLDEIWKILNTNGSFSNSEVIREYKSQSGVDSLVQISGWRGTFELLISLIAAIILALHTKIKPIEYYAKISPAVQPCQLDSA